MEIKTKLILGISWVVLSIGLAFFFGGMSTKYSKQYWYENDSYRQGKMIRNIDYFKNVRNILFFLSLFVFIIIVLCL